MDLTYTPAQKAFRAQVRAWLRDNVPSSGSELRHPRRLRAAPPVGSHAGFRRLQRRDLAQGAGRLRRGPDRVADLRGRVLGGRCAQRVNQNGILLFGSTLMEFGTAEQKARFLPRMARCDDMWAQGWSEPNAGSDMAAISSKAIRNGDKFVLNGQKIWSTRAIFADWLFGLFRSDRAPAATTA